MIETAVYAHRFSGMQPGNKEVIFATNISDRRSAVMVTDSLEGVDIHTGTVNGCPNSAVNHHLAPGVALSLYKALGQVLRKQGRLPAEKLFDAPAAPTIEVAVYVNGVPQ